MLSQESVKVTSLVPLGSLDTKNVDLCLGMHMVQYEQCYATRWYKYRKIFEDSPPHILVLLIKILRYRNSADQSRATAKSLLQILVLNRMGVVSREHLSLEILRYFYPFPLYAPIAPYTPIPVFLQGPDNRVEGRTPPSLKI